MEKTLNIYEKLGKIRDDINYLQKEVEGYGYKYVSEDAILMKVKQGMAKYGLVLTPSIKEGTPTLQEINYEKTKKLRDGSMQTEKIHEYVVTAEMTYRWTNLDNTDEQVEFSWFIVASQQDPAQAYGSALTYANRYAMLKFFQVPTSEDDVDAYLTRQKKQNEKDEKAQARQIVEQAHHIVTSLITQDETCKKDIVKIVEKHVLADTGKAGANYYVISKVETAEKLLQDIEAYRDAKLKGGK